MNATRRRYAAPPPAPPAPVREPSREDLARDASSEDEEGPDAEAQGVIERPDGYYWIAADGKHEFGPFTSAAEAAADMDRASETDLEPGETLEEAEQELGIAEWIDPDTGEPAEGTRTRLEDH
jgi:hypothetical protein